ncbi:MAG: carnitine 3-dehydrogenase [Pseudomonadales bacterium]
MTDTAAILGAGVIGGGWAARFLLSGWNVKVYDPDPEALRKIDAVLTNARRSMPGLFETDLPAEGNLTFADSLQDAVRDASWIQENVPERLELKQTILAQAQQACSKEAVLASSTSGFKPSQLQQQLERPAQLIVAHPFNPVYLLPLVELVGDANTVATASEVLSSLGMFPLHVRKEIDAHIADRLLEAVWREGLWLINDGIATTQEIDDAMRYGFGLRWAQMGMFDTYRVAGGEAGMAHFIAQFGPALEWPWTKLMDVPELTEELIQKIASQSNEQSGKYSIRELERLRDDNLVSILRALKSRSWGAGELLKQHDQRLRSNNGSAITAPVVSVQRAIPIDWTDYNDHMNESRYGQVFSDAADAIMALIGADAAYINTGMSYFTVETKIRYLEETVAGDRIYVNSQVLEGQGKKLRLLHQMHHRDGRPLASGEQLLIHVNLETRRACEPSAEVLTRKEQLAAAHSHLPIPEFVGD